MTKGTTSFGKHNKITHIRCRRCGMHSYHIRKKKCSACGFPNPKIKNENWRWKPPGRKKRKALKKSNQKIKTARMGRKKGK